jgi:hypothetical protein
VLILCCPSCTGYIILAKIEKQKVRKNIILAKTVKQKVRKPHFKNL